MRSFDTLCPYCNEPFQVSVDTSARRDELTQQCPHCGFPVDLRVQRDAQGAVVGVHPSDEEE
jgi:hypothetical protein